MRNRFKCILLTTVLFVAGLGVTGAISDQIRSAGPFPGLQVESSPEKEPRDETPLVFFTSNFNVGDVLAGVNYGTYNRYDAGGTFIESLVDGLGGYTTGCAGNLDRTLLYTTNLSSSMVVVYDFLAPHTIVQMIDTGLHGGGRCESIVFDANGDFYVGHAGGNFDVQKYDAAGNYLQNFDVAIENVGSDWIDLAIDQRTLFYTSEGRRIFRYDLQNDVQLADFTTLPGTGEAFALRLLPPFDGSGGLIVADRSEVRRLDGSGSVVQTYDAPGEDNWFAMNLDPDDTSFWAGDFGTDNFYKFDITTGAILVGPINTGVGGNLFGLCVIGEVTGASSQISLDPITDNNFVGTEHTVTATVLGPDGAPVSGEEVTFEVVSGPNTGTMGDCAANADCTTNAEGQVSFTYLGDGGPGTDQIEASFIDENGNVRMAVANNIWEINPLTDLYVQDEDILLHSDEGPVYPEIGLDITIGVTVRNYSGIAASARVLFEYVDDDGTLQFIGEDEVWVPASGESGDQQWAEVPWVVQDIDTILHVSVLDVDPIDIDLSNNIAQIALTPDTVPVFLREYHAQSALGGVLLKWRVVEDVSAFHLDRRLESEGTWRRVSPEAIAGPPSSPGEYFWLDADVINGQRYVYKLIGVTPEQDEFFIGTTTIDYRAIQPAHIGLERVYPNPFNPNTTVSFSVEGDAKVCIAVYDVVGRKVAVLTDEMYGAGSHSVEWSGKDASGRAVSSGTYLVRMEAADRIEFQKIMLVR